MKTGIQCLFGAMALLMTGLVQAQTVEDGYTVSVTGGDVHTLSRGLSGRVLIGGDFNSVQGQTRNRVALLSPDGTLDPFFNPNLGNGIVLDSLAHSSGDFVFVGSFTGSHSRMARYFFTGEPVPGFGAIIDARVRAVIENRDTGAIYIAGDFTQVGNSARSRVARLNPNGTADPTFVPPEFSGAVRAIARQPDGKILIAGNIMRVGDVGARRLYRLNDDGSWDDSFMVTNPVGAPHDIHTIAVQADGRILVGGDFPGHLRRYEANGSLDLNYEPPVLNSTVYSIDLQPDDRAIVGGDFTGVEGRLRLIRLHESGALDPSLRTLPSPGAAVRAVEVQPDGGVMIGGDFTQLANFNRNRLARLNASGKIDMDLALTSLDPDDFTEVRALAEGPEGSLYVGGSFTRFGGRNRTSVARVLYEGTVATDFAPLINGSVSALNVLSDGKILLGGGFSLVNGELSRRIARLNPDGSLDESFASPFNSSSGFVQSLLVQSDGRILVAGGIERPGSTARGIVRLNSDGSLDASFIAPSFDDDILAMAVDDQGRIVVGGRFGFAAGLSRQKLARLLPDGSLDPTFSPQFQFTSVVRAVAWWNNKILVGGNFLEVNGAACERLAQLSLDGTVDTCNNPGFGVHSLVPRADGRFYAGGRLSYWNGDVGRVTLFDSVNTPAPGFELISTPVSDLGLVRTLLIQSDGRLAVGGAFTSIGGQIRGGVARIRVNDDVYQTLSWDLGSEQVLWTRRELSRRIGAEPLGQPRVMVSQSCCDPASFVPAPGGGWMEETALGNWRLDNFAGLTGKFYILVEARVGDNKGAGTYTFRTPIYRFDGPPPPVIAADMEVKLLASQDEAEPGETIEFYLSVGNRGPSPATDAGLFVELPSGFTLTGFSATQGDFDPDNSFWKINDLDASGPGAGAELTLQVTVNAEGGHAVVAEVGADEFDPDYNNNVAQKTIDLILSRSDLQLSLLVDPQQVLPGESVVFYVDVYNAGPEPANAVEVLNQLPSGYSYLSHVASAGSYVAGSGLWTMPALAVGASAELRIEAGVNAQGDYVSISSASSNSIDPDPDNNLVFAVIDPFTDLAIGVSAGVSDAEVGDSVKFDIEVENLGPRTAQNVVANIVLPAGVDYSSSTFNLGSFDPDSGEWLLGTLGTDDGIPTLTIEVIIDEPADQTVSASLSTSTVDLDPSNNNDSTTVSVEGPAGDAIFSDRFRM
jgi:uncharacterized delta-60 repeat protein/uncharacterized repeat protein (TIGR01451 family)